MSDPTRRRINVRNMKHMKTIIAVVSAAALSVCISLIPSCRQKENGGSQKQRSENEIILTLQYPKGTTTNPEDGPWVIIDSHQGRSKIPQAQRDDIFEAIHSVWKEHKDNTVAVIRANPEELFLSITGLVAIAMRGRVYTLRLETGDIQAPLSIPSPSERSNSYYRRSGRHRKESAHRNTIYVLDGDQAGWFAIGNDKFKSCEALTDALVAIKKSSTEYPPQVIIAGESKAICRNFVLACKAAADAKIKFPAIMRVPKEHRQRPEVSPPVRKRRIKTPKTPEDPIPIKDPPADIRQAE